MAGGGGESGGAIVQSTAPWAAMQAGMLGNEAAYIASQQYAESLQDALNSINRQYSQSRYDMQPYRTTGVQALDQLNQYLGLDPYNPGAAPKAPTMPTLKSLQDQVKDYEIKQYITANTSMYGEAPGLPGTFVDKYTGNLPANSDWGRLSGALPMFNDKIMYGATPNFFDRSDVQQGAREAIAKDRLQGAMDEYDILKQNFDRDLLEYNQNLDWYNKYKAEGPLTSQQVSDKISNLPGYQAQMLQGTDAIQKSASAKGYLGSGRILKELQNFGQNTLSQFYGDELSRLAGLVSQGNNAATQTSQNSMSQGNALASLYQSLGENRANSTLAGGNAMANALIASNQRYQVMGGGGGGGMGGLGSILGGIGSIAGAFGGFGL